MLARLADFLRLTLDNAGAQEVTLQQELEFLRSYLEIERVRFQDRLTVQMEVAPDTLAARVPNLILQPIVENAIRHGIASRSGQGQIELRAQQNNGTLQLEVRNDGVGLASPKERIGITNTRARLRQLYGDRCHFDMVNADGGGVLVNVEIPVHA